MNYGRGVLKIVGYVLLYLGFVVTVVGFFPTKATVYYIPMGVGALCLAAICIWSGRSSKMISSAPPKMCENCLAYAPLKWLVFRQIVGMVFVFERKSTSGWMCRECAQTTYAAYSFKTLILGWLGRCAIFYPYILIENTVNFVDSLELPVDSGLKHNAPAHQETTLAESNHPEWKARYRVMAYHNSSGICVLGPVGSASQIMIGYETLQLPPALCERFAKWIADYDSRFRALGTYNARGMALSRELQQFLGKDIYVEYRGEAPDGVLLEPVPIVFAS